MPEKRQMIPYATWADVDADIIAITVRHIHKARQQARGFWELLEETVDHYITFPGVPLSETTPLLRQLIDLTWDEKDDDGRISALRSLLYYAWDRAREVQSLRSELAVLKHRLAALQYVAMNETRH